MTLDRQVGRFSNGQETIDVSSEHTRIGRFGDGQAAFHDPEDEILMGRFSTGQERLAETSEHVRVGRFSDQAPARSSIALSHQAETSGRLEVERVSS
jgi:hypothetical protein